ncbi:hypothetical protein Gotur_007637 [Gossypium turneri]
MRSYKYGSRKHNKKRVTA